jgi:hypothetical protein
MRLVSCSVHNIQTLFHRQTYMGDGVSFLSRFFLLLFIYQFYCFVEIVFKGKAILIAGFAVVKNSLTTGVWGTVYHFYHDF